MWSVYIAEREADFGPVDNWILGRDVGHAFLRFKDDDDKIILELHGLATDRITGKPVHFPAGLRAIFSSVAYAAGIKTHLGPLLQVHAVTNEHFMKALLGKHDSKEQLLMTGTPQDIAARIEAALRAADTINHARIDYYPFGIHGTGQNCISIMAELVEHMTGARPVPANIPFATPGITANLDPIVPGLSRVHTRARATPRSLFNSVRRHVNHVGTRIDDAFYATIGKGLGVDAKMPKLVAHI